MSHIMSKKAAYADKISLYSAYVRITTADCTYAFE